MNTRQQRVFITGIAGFIGFHLANALHEQGIPVSGIDNFNDYYDVALKTARAHQLTKKNISVIAGDIFDKKQLMQGITQCNPTHLVHLAAYAGVRHSIEHPEVYLRNNIDGFFEILQVAVQRTLPLIYASSSSVYGKNTKIPFSENDPTEQPTNMYGMSKKADELMAFAFHQIHGIPLIGLRFFTVYGPWGRPDMACYLFTRSIMNGQPIQLFNFGNMKRDFTYIDDIIQGILPCLNITSGNHIFNLGSSNPVALMTFVDLIEEAVGKKAIRRLLPMPKGEVIETFADITKSKEVLGFEPKVDLREGIRRFVAWYTEQH